MVRKKKQLVISTKSNDSLEEYTIIENEDETVEDDVIEDPVKPAVEAEVKPVESEVKPVVVAEVKQETLVEPVVEVKQETVVEPAEVEVKPAEAEVKPAEAEVKPVVVAEVKPAVVEVKPVEAVVKPAEVEVKPVVAEVKQETVVEAEVKPVDNIKYSDLLNNRNNIDYTKDILNGYYCQVIASETVNQYMCVERLIIDGNLRVRHTDTSCRNLFLGIAQNNASPGEVVNVLINGISIINARKNVNLPVLNRNNGQISTTRDKYGKVNTQSVSIPINKTDLLVLAGTNSDILAGPLTQYYQYNSLGNDGMLIPYKSIQINSTNLSYTINYTEQNNILGQKIVGGNKFIQVLDINIENGEMIGYLC